MVVISANTSAIDLVKSLKFEMVKKFKHEEREGIIQLWTEFQRNQPELTSRNVSTPSQSDLVNSLVKINTEGPHISALRNYIFTRLRDKQPPCNYLNTAFNQILSEWMMHVRASSNYL